MAAKSFVYFICAFILFQISWWVKLHVFGGLDTDEAFYFNLVYGAVAFFAALNGFRIANLWGGWKSYLGKTLILLSLGILSQWIANFIWGYYNLVGRIEIPYPSEADIFFFAVIPLYSGAMYFLAKSTGAGFSLRSMKGKVVAFIVPAVTLTIAYALFLDQGLDTSDPIRLFFDLGYPLGEVVTFSIAIYTYLLTRDYLGGIMKKAVLMVIGAYLLQFVADYGFLYTYLTETYYNANWVDLFYALAISGMSLAIVNFDMSLKVIRDKLSRDQSFEETAQTVISAPSMSQLNNTYNIYNTIILSIVKDQEKIIGPIAISEANSVKGLTISDDYQKINLLGDPEKITSELISNYKTLFGNASIEIMKESVNKAMKENPGIKEVNVKINL